MEIACEKLGWFTNPEPEGCSGQVNLGDVYMI